MISRVIIKFDKFIHDTSRAILVRVVNEEHWIPKKLLRNLVINKKLGGHFSLPFEIAKEKGFEVDEENAELIITHHIPKPIKAKKTDESLFR